MLKTQSAPANIIIQIREYSWALSPEVEQKISEIWKTEKLKRGDGLFNSEVLSFVQVEGEVLVARITDYRTYLAQARAPHLYDVLKVRKLAVSGLVALGSQIVFGKRAMHLTQDAGKWELAPSGGVAYRAADGNGRLTVEQQFFEELEEELGLQRSMVSSFRPLLFVEDTESHVIDIGIDVELSGNRTDIEAALKRRSDEYSEICWIDKSEIDQFCSVERQRGGIVEVSLELLKAKRLIR